MTREMRARELGGGKGGQSAKILFGGRIGGCLLICHRNVNIQIILNESLCVFFSSFWMFADVVGAHTHTKYRKGNGQWEGNGSKVLFYYIEISLTRVFGSLMCCLLVKKSRN